MRLGSRLIIAIAALALVTAGPANAAPKIPRQLLERLAQNPFAPVSVIVLGEPGSSSVSMGEAVSKSSSKPLKLKHFGAVPAVAVQLSAAEILRLSLQPGVLSITEDAPMASAVSSYDNPQPWSAVSGLAKLWPDIDTSSVRKPPAIAVIDTGVDATRADFGGRVVSQVTLTALPGNSAGDGSGHGTFVAALAAGSAKSYAGAAPTAQILSIDVADDKGMSMTSDVIAAVDWILTNKDAKKIGVANFSLHSSVSSSFVYDPLAKAVERLWLSGVVVVAAAGNYAANGAASGVLYAPANSPFVITVGAADIGSTVATSDDLAAPWSAHGYTPDGFAKPDLGAPGRYLVGPVTAGAALAVERPGKHRQARLYASLRHLLRSTPRRRRSRSNARPPPQLDAGSGQGRPDGLRSQDQRGSRVGSRRAQRLQRGDHPEPAEPEPVPPPLRRQRQLRLGRLGNGSAQQPGLERRLLVERLLELRLLVLRFLVLRFLVLGLLVVGFVVLGLVVERLLVERLVVLGVLELRLLDELGLRARPVRKPLERSRALEDGAQRVLQEDKPDHVEIVLERANRVVRYEGCQLVRIAIDPARDRRERDGPRTELACDLERAPVRRREQLRFAGLAALPHGADRMDHPAGR